MLTSNLPTALMISSLGQCYMAAGVMKRRVPHCGLTMCMHVRSLVFTCICKKRFSSVLHAKVMLNLPVWQDAPRGLLENYSALCWKIHNFMADWTLHNNQIQYHFPHFFCLKNTTKTAMSSIHTQPRPNTDPNSCWTSTSKV